MPSEFTPTPWSTVAEKADFANTLLRFVEAGWKPTIFTKKLYTRLSMCFGHIAHFSQTGFYEVWFTNEADRLRFLEHLLRWPCHGQPGFTFCDVEHAIQRELQARGYLELQSQRAAEEIRAAELQVLARLEQKYRRGSPEPGRIAAMAEVPQATPSSTHPSPLPTDLPIQGGLF